LIPFPSSAQIRLAERLQKLKKLYKSETVYAILLIQLSLNRSARLFKKCNIEWSFDFDLASHMAQQQTINIKKKSHFTWEVSLMRILQSIRKSTGKDNHQNDSVD
jgi:hypothetical protein